MSTDNPSSVTIQTEASPIPSVPAWFGEVALLAHTMTRLGLLSDISEQVRFNLEDQINTGMETRLELGQQQLRVANAGVAADVAKNNLLPRFDFVGSVGPQGIGGNPCEAMQDEFGWDHLNVTAGFQLEIRFNAGCQIQGRSRPLDALARM